MWLMILRQRLDLGVQCPGKKVFSGRKVGVKPQGSDRETNLKQDGVDEVQVLAGMSTVSTMGRSGTEQLSGFGFWKLYEKIETGREGGSRAYVSLLA